MDQIVQSLPGHRQQWLALLDHYAVGRPRSLEVMEAPGGLVQATIGEPPGRFSLEGAPANVLMFNMSPVQSLRQVREGRSFVSDMLRGEMTLMPRGIPSQWSWNSACDRLDVIISPGALGDGNALEVLDRFIFRDWEIEAICWRLYRELGMGGRADRLYVESLVIQLAALLLGRHSNASEKAKGVSSGCLTRNQARRVLDYIESNLAGELTLSGLAGIAGLSLHHFARMFKRTIGVAPHKYVLERRVERAKRMLRTKGTSLVEISLSTGFSSQSHFTTAFHRIVGATPGEFQGLSRSGGPSFEDIVVEAAL
jgi:AraC-like DNA-binding protein